MPMMRAYLLIRAHRDALQMAADCRRELLRSDLPDYDRTFALECLTDSLAAAADYAGTLAAAGLSVEGTR